MLNRLNFEYFNLFLSTNNLLYKKNGIIMMKHKTGKKKSVKCKGKLFQNQ